MHPTELASVLLPALFAGAVAIAVTVVVERLGGLVGGILGTLPTTIVPAALGIFDASAPEDFARAMYAVGPGMLLNALFLLVWGALPRRLPGALGFGARLGLTLAVSLGVWLSGALALVLLVGPFISGALGLTATVALALLGLVATARTRGTPRGKGRVTALVLLARGGAAALAIGLAVLIATAGNEVAAGVVSVFPAIFLTTMLALWLAHGEAVPGGAVGPMMVGSTAVAAFALASTLTLPAFGPALGAAAAWLGVALLVQLPLFFAARAVVGRLV